MPDPLKLHIKKNSQGTVVLPSGTTTQNQLVFWTNDDDQPHWITVPVSEAQPGVEPGEGPSTQTGPGNNSDPVQIYPNAGDSITAPIQVQYTCKLHPAEAPGIITVLVDFLSVVQKPVFNQLPNATHGQPYPPVLITAGGFGPYTHALPYINNPESGESLPPGITVSNQSGGVAVTGQATVAGDFAFTVQSQDAVGNRLEQQYLITVV
jgi:hypothetical protein